MRRVPSSLGSPFDVFLAFVGLAAVNAALAAAVPAVAAARLSEGRAAGRVIGAAACGVAGFIVYLLAGLTAWAFRHFYGES